MIEISELVRKYGDVVAVDHVGTTIEQGEIVGLLGHNGAGKTTLMKMITGFIEPTAGSVKVGGLDAVERRLEVQRLIGYLPENAPLYPEMLVQEYLLMMAELRGLSSKAADEAVSEAVRRTGLIEYLIRPISTLSKGYRQRVGIAQAILHKPQVLVLDEPTNGLDPVQIQSIRELIRELGQTATIILSTHILQEIEAVCERVLVMIGGKLVTDAPLTDLLGATRLSLSVKGERIEERLQAIDSIVSVQKVGDDPRLSGFDRYAVTPSEGATPGPEIIAAGTEAGWTIGALAAEQRTLESVFKELQDREVARGRQEVTG